jgi:hypothetical protein
MYFASARHHAPEKRGSRKGGKEGEENWIAILFNAPNWSEVEIPMLGLWSVGIMDLADYVIT